MSKQEKLIEKLKAGSSTMTFDEIESLLLSLGYRRNNKGRTSGSRISFSNEKLGIKIMLHKPHPGNEMKDYQLKQIREHLVQEGLI